MKLFKCQHCGQVLYFENVRCERCGHALGYMPDSATLSALEPEGGELWRSLAKVEGQFRYCDNAQHEACNWLVPADSPSRFCTACSFNHTVPDLTVPENLPPWRKIEVAKHRLFYTMLRLGLPLADRTQDPEHGLAFDFLADEPVSDGPKVMTGHDNGLITLALAEADDAERERRRVQMGEPYRTLLGHFRHEIGHYFWDVLVRDGGRLDECRALFGDDTEDYAEALQRHYDQGPPAGWQESFISTYATTHPWEDFAETWAHYLHIVDTLEMARAFGVSVNPHVDTQNDLTAEVDFDPHKPVEFQRIIDAWLPLCFAMNSMNRCMGAADLYPFVLSPPVIEKLGFIHKIVHEQRG